MTTGPMAASAHLVHLATSVPWYISPGDTVKLAPLAEPTQTHGASVFLEVWEPGGAQPLNSHPHATETFLFLAGQGIAISDGTQVAVRAGDLLILPPGTQHRILNAGEGRLCAITTMNPDEGFLALVRSGEPTEWHPEELAWISAWVEGYGLGRISRGR
jgi:mannose-6-phosphate isomerase-like protein (cupin superfamily)